MKQLKQEQTKIREWTKKKVNEYKQAKKFNQASGQTKMGKETNEKANKLKRVNKLKRASEQILSLWP